MDGVGAGIQVIRRNKTSVLESVEMKCWIVMAAVVLIYIGRVWAEMGDAFDAYADEKLSY